MHKRLTWARGYPRQPLSLGDRRAGPERYKEGQPAGSVGLGSVGLGWAGLGWAGREPGERAGVCRWAEPESRVVRRARIRAAAAAVARATARMAATAAAPRLTAMPEPMPLVSPCMLISRGAISRPATVPQVTPSRVRIIVLVTSVATTWRGVRPMAASTPTSCRWSRIPTTVAVSRLAFSFNDTATTETAIT